MITPGPGLSEHMEMSRFQAGARLIFTSAAAGGGATAGHVPGRGSGPKHFDVKGTN